MFAHSRPVDIAKKILREPSIENEHAYLRRVRMLAGTYLCLFIVCLTGLFALTFNVKLFVTLAQRSNVETLTIAFFLLLFVYLAVLSSRGAWGALRLAALLAVRALHGKDAFERVKQRRLGSRRDVETPSVAMNLAVENAGDPGKPIDIPVRDSWGEVGKIRIQGARMDYLDFRGCGSNDLLVYASSRIQAIGSRTKDDLKLDIVEWKSLDEEAYEKFLAQVEFARNLSRHLGPAEPLWPSIRFTEADRKELERMLSPLCPAIREEALLPLWEYTADHKLPVIPEPLGIISLSRSEKRVDPIASMGAALVIVAIGVAISLLMIFTPPWVPGT